LCNFLRASAAESCLIWITPGLWTADGAVSLTLATLLAMDWRDRARQQAGVISREQFADCGVSEDEVRGLVRRRDLTEVLPCVYSPRPVPQSNEQQQWAAVLWSGGVLSHRSAAMRWRLPVPTTSVQHVTVGDRRFRGVVRGVQVHRVLIDPAGVTTCFGLPATTRARTVIDLMRTEKYGLATELRDRALQQQWIDELTITRSISEQLGRTGNAQLRRLRNEIVAGAQAASERLLHAILRGAGLTGWVPQYRVRVGGRIRFIDVAFPESRIAIEVDGRRAHDDFSDRFDDDRARQNDLVAAGWRVLRFTWSQLQDPAYVISRIRQLAAA
jgi:very-short-patch-repair endonuclease